MANIHPETLVILDYGSQYTQLIARRMRELGVYSRIMPANSGSDEILALRPLGIVLSGGPSSVYDLGSLGLDKALVDSGVPMLGICYGMQLLASLYGGRVESSDTREYGPSHIKLISNSRLFDDITDDSQVWMSHGDHVIEVSDDFIVTAKSGSLIAAMEHKSLPVYGVQFHPEVSHSVHGRAILKAFLSICGFSHDWSPASLIATQTSQIRGAVGAANVVCGLSGGVDSSVAATLVHHAIGAQQTCIFVDTGLLRLGEFEEVLNAYKTMQLNVVPVRAGKRFLKLLQGVTDPEEKRRIIGHEFIRIFDEEAAKIKGVQYLVQGTLYPDVIESYSVHGPSHTIKSHHNVGGLPKEMKLKLIEPLRELFKDEVRAVGSELELPDSIVRRQPFPGPGLAIRIIGEVTPSQIQILQRADKIVRDEIEASPERMHVWQFFAVLLPVRSVGVMGDGRTYEQVVAVRAVSSSDGMTADWAKLPHELLARISSRIVSEVRGINRVVYDITSKPPGTVEWE